MDRLAKNSGEAHMVLSEKVGTLQLELQSFMQQNETMMREYDKSEIIKKWTKMTIESKLNDYDQKQRQVNTKLDARIDFLIEHDLRIPDMVGEG